MDTGSIFDFLIQRRSYDAKSRMKLNVRCVELIPIDIFPFNRSKCGI